MWKFLDSGVVGAAKMSADSDAPGKIISRPIISTFDIHIYSKYVQSNSSPLVILQVLCMGERKKVAFRPKMTVTDASNLCFWILDVEI